MGSIFDSSWNSFSSELKRSMDCATAHVQNYLIEAQRNDA